MTTLFARATSRPAAVAVAHQMPLCGRETGPASQVVLPLLASGSVTCGARPNPDTDDVSVTVEVETEAGPLLRIVRRGCAWPLAGRNCTLSCRSAEGFGPSMMAAPAARSIDAPPAWFSETRNTSVSWSLA